MARAPFQVLVFAYKWDSSGRIEYAVFSRSDYACWRGIAGGGKPAYLRWEQNRPLGT